MKGLCAEVPVARTTFYARYRNVDDVLAEVEDDPLAEMAASAVIGAYAWWMEHPEAAGIDEAKRQVERAVDAIVASI